jgi:hypothetical protein
VIFVADSHAYIPPAFGLLSSGWMQIVRNTRLNPILCPNPPPSNFPRTDDAAPSSLLRLGFCVTLCRKNHDLWVAVNLWFNGVCKVKNRLIGDFLMFVRKAQRAARLTAKRRFGPLCVTGSQRV